MLSPIQQYHPNHLHSKRSAAGLMGIGFRKLQELISLRKIHVVDGRIPQWAIDEYQRGTPGQPPIMKDLKQLYSRLT